MKNLYSWQRGSKDLFHVNKGLFLVLKLVWGGTTISKLKSFYVLLVHLKTLQEKSGLAYTCQYMKACAIYVMKYVAKDPNKLAINSFSILVSLTDSGIPRIIPSYIRYQLRRGNKNSIKALLTVFNLYRVLEYPGVLKLSTITDSSSFTLPSDFSGWLAEFMRSQSMTVPFKISDLLNPFLIYSSGPCSPKGMNNTAGWILAFRRLKALFLDKEFFLTLLDPYKERRQWWESSPFIKYFNAILPDFDDNVSLGKLAFKEEPGKVRVFAMADCITQWVLHPLHQYLFSILKQISIVDATFDQEEGVKTLSAKIKAGKRVVFSLDLSAATDRLPLTIQAQILNHIVPKLGDHWANLLVNRDYSVPNHTTLPVNPGTVRYGAGQPMGAYSSWAMLALTHHFIVQYCAFKVYHTNSFFKDYLILGDDLLLLDAKVAKQYLQVMNQLDVGVNLAKSLISVRGYGEFAKQFLSPDGPLQGVSLREFSSLKDGMSNILSLSTKMNLKPALLLRLFGFGSKSIGHSTLPFTRYSLRSSLDHLFISPLANSSNKWLDYFSCIRHLKSLTLNNSLLRYFLWGFEFLKYKWVYMKVRENEQLMLKHGTHHYHQIVSETLLNYWCPSPTDEVLKSPNIADLSAGFFFSTPPIDKASFKVLMINHINILFSCGSLFTELMNGGAMDLVPKFLTFELSFEEGYSDFENVDNDHLWSVITRDPKSWVKPNNFGGNNFDIVEFMSQQPSVEYHQPRTLKEISLALQLKKDLFDSGLVSGSQTILDVPLFNKKG
ncbi:RNA-dependent RNA polymerase [Ophiostoma mitovirus 1b]|uniref:RNA-dependent RNA polymerase n=1 Tax=Ophiostoma mitovirus 1b TaxID=348095 RepID=A0ABM9ML45_9VIRU|nr:RNA-dependent RNA polymerase [Ophiostoma mitovirus 1b]CAJ32467.1 RNA-dependent RNA polymerase [Ophiostoma mitovirus 1b]